MVALFGWLLLLCNVSVKSEFEYYIPEFNASATENLVNYDHAIQKCEINGDTLANIRTENNDTLAINICQTYVHFTFLNNALGCWTGINNIDNITEYVYSDGTNVAGNFGFDVNGVPNGKFETWFPMQPDNDNHRCIATVIGGDISRAVVKWDDVDCLSTLFVPLCERSPTPQPTVNPTITPTIVPSIGTEIPSIGTEIPSIIPSNIPSNSPTENPIILPTISPSTTLTIASTKYPTTSPSILPSVSPTPISETDTPTTSPVTTTNSPTNTPPIIPTTNSPTTRNITNITPIITSSPSQTPSQNPTLTPDKDAIPQNPQNAKKGVENPKRALILALIAATLVVLCLCITVVLYVFTYYCHKNKSNPSVNDSMKISNNNINLDVSISNSLKEDNPVILKVIQTEGNITNGGPLPSQPNINNGTIVHYDTHDDLSNSEGNNEYNTTIN